MISKMMLTFSGYLIHLFNNIQIWNNNGYKCVKSLASHTAASVGSGTPKNDLIVVWYDIIHNHGRSLRPKNPMREHKVNLVNILKKLHILVSHTY